MFICYVMSYLCKIFKKYNMLDLDNFVTNSNHTSGLSVLQSNINPFPYLPIMTDLQIIVPCYS